MSVLPWACSTFFLAGLVTGAIAVFLLLQSTDDGDNP
jgi:hypothetical protein